MTEQDLQKIEQNLHDYEYVNDDDAPLDIFVDAFDIRALIAEVRRLRELIEPAIQRRLWALKPGADPLEPGALFLWPKDPNATAPPS